MEVSAKRWPSRGLARLARNKHKSSEAYLAAARRTPKIKYHTFRPLRPPFTHPPVHPSFHALADNAANKISLPPPRNYNKHIKSTKYIYIYISKRVSPRSSTTKNITNININVNNMNVSYTNSLSIEKRRRREKKKVQRLARRAVKKKERRRRSEKKKKRQRGTNLFPSLPTEKTDRERERRREEGGGGSGMDFLRASMQREMSGKGT